MTRPFAPQVRERTAAKARTLLEALPFMREHLGRVIVVRLGGAAMDRSALTVSFGEDIALLQSAGITAVIVHGTPSDTPSAGVRTREVVGVLSGVGVRAVGLSGSDGGLLVARRHGAPDFAFEGEEVRVDVEVLRTLTERGFVPVVASIAVDDAGQGNPMNADGVASELAVALEAEKVVFIDDVPGLIGPTGDLLSELPAQQCRDLLARGGDVVTGGMVPRLEAAVRALKAGVGRVHLVDARVEHALVLELFTPEGVGTMITPDAEGPGVGT